MIKSLWQWFIIGLVISGASAGIIGLVVCFYAFVLWCHVSDTVTDKLTTATAPVFKFAGNTLFRLLD